jgi:hypothetical protein
MATSATYVLCGADDSWRNALMDCSMALIVWALSEEGLVEHMCLNQVANAKNWIFVMHEMLSHGDFIRMVVTLWAF